LENGGIQSNRAVASERCGKAKERVTPELNREASGNRNTGFFKNRSEAEKVVCRDE
jgi:hypothetical protein